MLCIQTFSTFSLKRGGVLKIQKANPQQNTGPDKTFLKHTFPSLFFPREGKSPAGEGYCSASKLAEQ